MWPAALIRLVKRRLLYIAVLLIFSVYMLSKLLAKPTTDYIDPDDFETNRTQPLNWRSMEEHFLPPEKRVNPPDDMRCRNSIQGPDLIVDDRGFVCEFEQLFGRTGCCNVQHESTKYYSCLTCDPHLHCCGIYEYCVSCCLHPKKRQLLELTLKTMKSHQSRIYNLVADHFDLCLYKCRTNSHSVLHENRYRDLEHRYCYGPTKAHPAQVVPPMRMNG